MSPAAIEPAADPDYMRSLARGIAVLRAFEGRAELTPAEAARATGLGRAAAGRCLHTLGLLGLVREVDGGWRQTAALLPLACAYLGSSPLATIGQQVANALRDRLDETVSLGTLDPANTERIVYLGRAERNRIIAAPLVVGSTLPAHCTSMGRVMLAALGADDRARWLHDATLSARTPRTVTTKAELASILDDVAAQGRALVDGELELGLVSLAVAVRDRAGRVEAALNVATFAGEHDVRALERRLLPELRAAASEIERSL